MTGLPREQTGVHTRLLRCALELNKREQASDWARRPLSHGQVAYAALDAEVLLRLHGHFNAEAASE